MVLNGEFSIGNNLRQWLEYLISVLILFVDICKILIITLALRVAEAGSLLI
jgi:hypothetical protein